MRTIVDRRVPDNCATRPERCRDSAEAAYAVYAYNYMANYAQAPGWLRLCVVGTLLGVVPLLL